MTTEEKRTVLRNYRTDTFFWGWTWCATYGLVVDNMLTGKYIADSFGLTLGLFVASAMFASYLGRKTRLPLTSVAD